MQKRGLEDPDHGGAFTVKIHRRIDADTVGARARLGCARAQERAGAVDGRVHAQASKPEDAGRYRGKQGTRRYDAGRTAYAISTASTSSPPRR